MLEVPYRLCRLQALDVKSSRASCSADKLKITTEIGGSEEEVNKRVRDLAKDLHTIVKSGNESRAREATKAEEAAREEDFNSNDKQEGGPPRAGGRVNQGVLRPSFLGRRPQARRDGDVNAGLRPVLEAQDSESAVVCMCFGQERLHKFYILLATGYKDGTAVVYRCYRTEMEISLLSDQEFQQEKHGAYSQPPTDHSDFAVHSCLFGHTRPITSIFFSSLEDQLVTTSIDKTVRFWGIDSGHLLKRFHDACPVLVATFLPSNPQVFVAAISNCYIKLVNVQSGTVLQRLKVESPAPALKFDDTGSFCIAGTRHGHIHVFEASDSDTMTFKFKMDLACGSVIGIVFVPASYGQPPRLFVSTTDSSATLIDCTYGPPAGALTNLVVRRRVRISSSLLPLKSCFSPSGHGYFISGSEDRNVYVYSLAEGSTDRVQFLERHQVPVLAVAVNLQDTLLASGDALGRIVLWRRKCLYHIPD